MLSKIKNMPLGISGLALGFAGYTSLLTTITKINIIAYVGAVIAFIFVSIIILKMTSDLEIFRSEIKNPVASSIMPSIDMSIMVIAISVVQFSYILGRILWVLAIALHFILLFIFIYNRFKQKDFYKIIPSWFVPSIGIVTACVTSAQMNFPHISHFLFYFGFILYIFILPFVLYKMFFLYNIEDNIAPAFAIMGAPANLLLAGYLTAFENPNPIIIHLLLGMALFTTFIVYISFFRVYKLKFTPLFASYTFPLSIGATALVQYYLYVEANGLAYISLWKGVAYFETIVAGIIIFYIFINMLIFIYKHILRSV